MLMHRQHKLLVLGAVVVCLLVAVVIVKWARAGSSRDTAGTGGDGDHVVYAAVAPVKRETIANSLSIAGQFIPYQNVELHAKVAGYIKQHLRRHRRPRPHRDKCWRCWRFRNWWPRSMRRRLQCTMRKKRSSARRATCRERKPTTSPCTPTPTAWSIPTRRGLA